MPDRLTHKHKLERMVMVSDVDRRLRRKLQIGENDDIEKAVERILARTAELELQIKKTHS